MSEIREVIKICREFINIKITNTGRRDIPHNPVERIEVSTPNRDQ